MKTRARLSTSLILLTCLFVFTQILLLTINIGTTSFFDIAVSTSITQQILSSKIFMLGMLHFLASQFFIYTLYVALIWYLAVSTGALLRFKPNIIYVVGMLLFINTTVCLLAANAYYVPFSFFAVLFRDHLLNNPLSDSALKIIFYTTASILAVTIILSSIKLCLDLWVKKHLLRHSLVLGILASMLVFMSYNTFMARTLVTPASASQPNVIIIGIDALRPDFVGFNNHTSKTPHIDEFLRTGTNFAAAYTPLPRTFPSWTSILTGTYPLHNKVRGNSTDFSELNLSDTLPKKFQQAGYTTIYATDDTRFNNTNEQFGFDQLITPPMGLNDFLIGTMNDFPLSNLIVPTSFGRILFPYNYGNHGTAITYAPKNFLHLLKVGLQQRKNKPVFLAVHFTITHWPFYWFNDRQPAACNEFCRAQTGITRADRQFAEFMRELQASGLLDHALVILLSDHGMSLGLHGDRTVSANLYEGDKANINKLQFYRYSTAAHFSTDVRRDFGVDTSYGYGGDVLSLVQYHAVLAFKSFGLQSAAPHTVTARVLLTDIAPTILDLLQMPALFKADGISLKSYVLNQTTASQPPRPFFLESTFSIEEIEKEGISLEKVLAKTAKLYRMDERTGLIFIKNSAEQSMTENKQHAIMQGDWLLARYPAQARNKFSVDSITNEIALKPYTTPAFMVLVNLKTGQWTTELDNAFAHTAPLDALRTQLQNFYGNELGLG